MQDGARRGAGRRMVTGAALLACVIAAGLLGACGGGSPRGAIEFRGDAMGTAWSVKVVAGREGLSHPARLEVDRAIRDHLARLEALMSTWNPASELSRFNQSASVERFPAAPEMVEVFRWAATVAEETGGALDVTVGPLVDAWGFGAAGDRGAGPDEATLARLREAVGMRHLEIDPGGRWVRKRRPDVRVDLSALAPGFAADGIALDLTRRGFADVLVDVGGELVARGRNDAGRPWQVAVEQPEAVGRAIARIVPLRDLALATSGDYRNYQEVEGVRLPHILDPRTGRPIRHRLTSVTVVDERGVRADALATALMVLGPEDGMALARRLALPAFFILRAADGGFEQYASPEFEALARP